MTGSRSKPAPTRSERAHIERIASLACACCEVSGPSQVHEVAQGDWWTAIPLCPACHTGPGGIHGDRALLRVRKLDEWGAMSRTVRMLMSGR